MIAVWWLSVVPHIPWGVFSLLAVTFVLVVSTVVAWLCYRKIRNNRIGHPELFRQKHLWEVLPFGFVALIVGFCSTVGAVFAFA